MVKDIKGQVREKLCRLKKETVTVEFVVNFVDSQKESWRLGMSNICWFQLLKCKDFLFVI